MLPRPTRRIHPLGRLQCKLWSQCVLALLTSVVVLDLRRQTMIESGSIVR